MQDILALLFDKVGNMAVLPTRLWLTGGNVAAATVMCACVSN